MLSLMINDLQQWFENLKRNSTLHRFQLPTSNKHGIELFVKRDDLIDAYISGNKIRKLEHNLLAAQREAVEQIHTYGGAYSNHLLASAAVSKKLKQSMYGWVRGEELNAKSNTLLMECGKLGMGLKFLERDLYNQHKLSSGLSYTNGKSVWYIPEGGANPQGILGCTEIYTEAVAQNGYKDFDVVVVAQGTTTTSLGILASIPKSTILLVVPVLKGFNALTEMQKLATKAKQEPATAHLRFSFDQLKILDQYHHGGYAKSSSELNEFIGKFNASSQFPIESIYTAKALFALQDQLLNFKQRSILFIHTGGIKKPTER